jgi:RNA polymerase sigma-70 factor (ECF subfamily)
MSLRHNLALRMTRADELPELIARAAAGDEVALAQLYDRTSSLVHGLALKILGEPQAAEEITVDVYLQVWRQAERYDASRGAALGWLLTIARTRSIDRLRRHRSQTGQTWCREPGALEGAVHTGTTAGSAGGLEDVVGAAERRQAVQRALMHLAPEERRTIELAYYQGLSHSEIAARLGTPLGTVKTRIRLGMMRLRQELGDRARELG